MYKIAYSKSWKPGRCELTGRSTDHLERHHIRYNPEITIDLDHESHFTVHYFPDRLLEEQKLKLLHKIMSDEKAREFLSKYSKDRVRLALAFAPSRRDSVLLYQKQK